MVKIARVVVPGACYVGRSLALSDHKRKVQIPKIKYGIHRIWYFYKPLQMRTLEEIMSDIRAIEKETDGLLNEIVGEAK